MSETQGYKKLTIEQSVELWREAVKQSRQKTIDNCQALFARLVGKDADPEILDVLDELLQVLILVNELRDGAADHVSGCPDFSLNCLALYAHKYLTKKVDSVAVGKVLLPVIPVSVKSWRIRELLAKLAAIEAAS